MIFSASPSERREIGASALVRDGIGRITTALGDHLARVTDPLRRLLDPMFTETLWEYEGSHIGPMIPGQLHAKQEAALAADAKHRWLFWGNQVGKSTTGAIDVAMLALGRHPFLQKWNPPVTIWASALTWELWENVLLPELLTWIPADRIIDAPQPYKNSTKRHILVRADNGKISRITGKAAEQGPAKYQSARVHLVWLDEEHPEEVYDEMLPRLLRFGGITLATMTPLKGLTWVYDRVYEPWKEGKVDPKDHYVSHAGLRDNPAIRPEEIAALEKELEHNPAQLAARLEGQFVRPQGLVLRNFDPDRHFRDYTEEELKELIRAGAPFAAIDFGAWRFAFILAIADLEGRLHLIDELFSQNESYGDVVNPDSGLIEKKGRARRIHDKLTHWKIDPDKLVGLGDCANPQDIIEINMALVAIKSPYRFGACDAEHKIIENGVNRLEDLFGRNAFSIRRGMGSDATWNLGMNASRAGKPVRGSRWLWEANNWHYPKAKDETKAQKQEPDDATADGADMMAASRYLVMRWWAPEMPTPAKRAPTLLERLQAEMDRLDEPVKDNTVPHYRVLRPR